MTASITPVAKSVTTNRQACAAWALQPLSIRDKFAAAREEMGNKLVERDEEITLSLCALLCREHLLLVGAPGTAKSLMVRALGTWMTGGKVFEYLLTRFTEPDEIFGQVSVKGMQEDDYRRLTAHKLPEAHFAFLDEYFKGSSAIINTTLTVMNERIFHNGLTTMECPLQSLFGASNEWPSDTDGGKDLGAAFDRFLFRKTVRRVGYAGRKKLLRNSDHTPRFAPEVCITPEEIDQAHAEVVAMPILDSTWRVYETILADLGTQGVEPGDRRMLKSVKTAQAFAWLQGETEVHPEHLEIMRHTLWEDPIEQPEKVEAIVAKHANPIGMRVAGWLSSAEEIRASVVPNDVNAVIAASNKLDAILKTIRQTMQDTRSRDPRLTAAEARLKEVIVETRLTIT